MINPLSNVLCLSPHRDDECLGPGGTLLRSDNVYILYFNKRHPLVNELQYNREADLVKERLRARTYYTNYPNVNRLHTHPIDWHISEIESVINKIRPTLVLIPARSRNQDHQVVYDAAMVAIRPHDKNFFVPNVWIYEQHEYMTQDFMPNTFVEIDINAKVRLFELYKSQQRSYRTSKHLAGLAVLRGSQCNKDYAEAFMSIRGCY